MFWNDGFSKKIALEYDFSCIFPVKKLIFPFPENMILFFRRKMKDNLSPKIYGNLIFCASFLKRWSFQKNSHRNMIVLQLSEKMIFLFIRNSFLYLLTSNWYAQIFKSVQLCAPPNAGGSITTPLTRATKNIINWSISFIERAKNVFR